MSATEYQESPAEEQMFSALRASGPHPEFREELMLFGQFVGVWDMDIRAWDQAGQTIFHGSGEWSFGFVLDGRAVQDVLITPNSAGTTEPGQRGIGTTLRCYDPRLSAWRVVWNGVVSGTFIRLIGRKDGDEILLEGGDDDGALVRWTFSEIRRDRFHWIGMISNDGGVTWWMDQEMDGVRRG